MYHEHETATDSKYENQGVRLLQYSTMDWSDMLERLDSPLPACWYTHSGRFTHYPSSSDNAYTSYDWDLNTDFSKAKHYAAYGWPEGTEAFGAVLQHMDTRLASVLRTWDVRRSVDGGDIDIGAFISGMPEHFLVPEDTYVPMIRGSVRNVIVSTAMNADVGTDTVRRRGVYTMGLVRALELAGQPVRIVSLSTVRMPGSLALGIMVTIREPGHDIDLARMAFVGHPAYHRRITFRLRELGQAAPLLADKYRYTYGRAMDPSPDMCAAMFGEGSIYVSNAPELWASEEVAWGTMKGLLRAQGVYLESEGVAV